MSEQAREPQKRVEEDQTRQMCVEGVAVHYLQVVHPTLPQREATR
jgi:hypothetical protein